MHDPIYGVIELLPCQVELINTLHFQRLTRLKQLGVSYRVFPGATHTRAEHSLGVAWLSRKLLRQIRIHQPHIAISERDERLIVLAAQAHDLGHGVASHTFEAWLRSRNLGQIISENSPCPPAAPHTGPKLRSHVRQMQQTVKQISARHWSHEEQSVALFQHAVDSGALPCLADDTLGVKVIKALILGRKPMPSKHTGEEILEPSKLWMLDIVNNACCGIDVDRLDYLQRDAHHVLGSSGDGGLMNVDRIINGARVTDDGQHIAFDIELLDTLYHLFHRRLSMFRSVYLHNDVVACELALRGILDSLYESPIFYGLKAHTLSSLNDYLLLDDTVFAAAMLLRQQQRHEAHTSNGFCKYLERACSEWENFQRGVNQYRCVAQANVTTNQFDSLAGEITAEKLYEQFARLGEKSVQKDSSDAEQPRADRFVLHCCAFHFGSGTHDPQSRIWFYKNQGDQKIVPYRLQPLNIDAMLQSRLMPNDWQEWQIRVYFQCTESNLVPNANFCANVQTALQKLIEK